MIGGYLDEAARVSRLAAARRRRRPRRACRSCTTSTGARRLTEFELPWLPGLRRLAAGARRQRRLRAVPARRLRRGAVVPVRRRASWGLPRRARARWPAAARAHRVPRGARGSGPTTASGRCAAAGATSRTRRSWRGSRSIAPSRLIEEFGVGGDEGRSMLPHLRALRERIHAEVCERGFNPRVGRVHAVVRQRRRSTRACW